MWCFNKPLEENNNYLIKFDLFNIYIFMCVNESIEWCFGCM